MSNSWSGGKGDKSRIINHNSYWDNYDKIYNRNMNDKPMKCLFLDDVRDVPHAYLWDDGCSLLEKSGIPVWKWDIVRSYDEFVKYIDDQGIPDVVSFDNDLFDFTDNRVTPKELSKQFQMIGWEEFEIKTGAHCAQYLVKACKARKVPIPRYYIHTANSAARPIIKRILENAKV
jgi:predicted RNA binding protein YcfA (HicA-like mRNA interferase family)